jgi:hypothetical protein
MPNLREYGSDSFFLENLLTLLRCGKRNSKNKGASYVSLQLVVGARHVIQVSQ